MTFFWQNPRAVLSRGKTDTCVGCRVELHPGHDLWMRGARYGTVRRIGGPEGDTLWVKMDHPSVKKLVRVRKDEVAYL